MDGAADAYMDAWAESGYANCSRCGTPTPPGLWKEIDEEPICVQCIKETEKQTENKKVKVFITGNNKFGYKVHWTEKDALERMSKAPIDTWRMLEADIDPVSIPVDDYFKFRDYKSPDLTQAFMFLTSEVGELSDEIVQSMSDEWVRNNPENKGRGIKPEIGDVLMMLTRVAMSIGVDPIAAMFEKFKSKGWK